MSSFDPTKYVCGESAIYPLEDYVTIQHEYDLKYHIPATVQNTLCCYKLTVVSPLTRRDKSNEAFYKTWKDKKLPVDESDDPYWFGALPAKYLDLGFPKVNGEYSKGTVTANKLLNRNDLDGWTFMATC